MVYMVGMDVFSDVKVGFTDNIARRLEEYRGHNPHIVLIDMLEGDRNLETEIHARMREMGFISDGREWMIPPRTLSRKKIHELGFKIFC